MKRRLTVALALAGVFCFFAVAADLPDKWRSWRYSRAIEGTNSDDNLPAELNLPWEMFVHCRPDCADLRIVNSSGAEVPYVLQEKHTQQNPQSHGAGIIENSFVAGHYTQVIGDLGGKPINYDRVRVETSRPD
ncbi:MAG TPA: hypothetical protein VGF20_03335, partial [Candidatus Acidoferrum sp.]